MEQHETSVPCALTYHRPPNEPDTPFSYPDRARSAFRNSLRRQFWKVVDVIRFPIAVEQLAELLTTSAQDLGFDYFSYISLAGLDCVHSNDQQIRYISNQPAEWIIQYKRDRLQHSDPVVALGRMNWKAFVWDTKDQGLRTGLRQEQVLVRAQSFGFRCGITAPIHGPNRDLSLLTFSCGKPRSDLYQTLPEIGSMLLVFGVCIGSWMESHMPYSAESEEASLSMREKECLLWTARGKTSWEIAKIIGRSEDTVNFHLKNASSKLNASNKCHAVSKAIIQGHLLL